MKIQTFDTTIIAELMLGSDALKQGILYMKCISPGISDDVAKLTAIRTAQETCQRKWYNDQTGYISNERIAFREFEGDVKAGRYFNTDDYLCPNCKSRNFSKRSFMYRFLTASIWNGFKGRSRYVCNDCNHKW